MDFEGSKRSDETNAQWFQRVISEPFMPFDATTVQGLFDGIEEKRAQFDKGTTESGFHELSRMPICV
jgi:hypothetical protein